MLLIIVLYRATSPLVPLGLEKYLSSFHCPASEIMNKFHAGIKWTNSVSFLSFCFSAGNLPAPLFCRMAKIKGRIQRIRCRRWRCQRNPCSRELPTAIISMGTMQEESLDPDDPRWRAQMRKNWIIWIKSPCELSGQWSCFGIQVLQRIPCVSTMLFYLLCCC